MKYTDKPLAQVVISLCKEAQIQHIVISPGSRNAPLTLGFVNDPFFKIYSIVDERCAGFFALGIAQQLQKPVALVCTSGSALLNYYPAISEAYYSHVPLVVISADRPADFIDIGDGQTIRQANVYANHIGFSANLLDCEDVLDKQFSKNISLIREAMHNSSEKMLPVHINVPLEEPLYGLTDKRIDIAPQKTKEFVPKPAAISEITLLAKLWNQSPKKMILVGTLAPNSIDRKWIEKLAVDSSVIVLTETTSNLHHPNFINSIDKLIAPLNAEELEKLKPDLLITIGGMIVSKKIKAFLRTYKPKSHWHIGKHEAYDTYFCLKGQIKCNPNEFLKIFLDDIKSQPIEYQLSWLAIREKHARKHQTFLNQIPFSDFKVFDTILASIPDNCLLQLSNSSTIRYAQLFDVNPSLQVFCNRGTSGIDGSTSTSVGAAVVCDRQTVFVSGDLSFFYDSNALWNNYIPNSFRIIVINNQGGGIFRILPGYEETANFKTYFETSHNLTAKQLCEMYGFEYTKADEMDNLNCELHQFYERSDKPKLLEIFTPRLINDKILKEYFNFIK